MAKGLRRSFGWDFLRPLSRFRRFRRRGSLYGEITSKISSGRHWGVEGKRSESSDRIFDQFLRAWDLDCTLRWIPWRGVSVRKDRMSATTQPDFRSCRSSTRVQEGISRLFTQSIAINSSWPVRIELISIITCLEIRQGIDKWKWKWKDDRREKLIAANLGD